MKNSKLTKQEISHRCLAKVNGGGKTVDIKPINEHPELSETKPTLHFYSPQLSVG